MLGPILRLLIAALVLAGLAIFFVYAFIAALIATPFILLFVYLLSRQMKVQWAVMERQPSGRAGPVIDHDPNDLPRPRDQP